MKSLPILSMLFAVTVARPGLLRVPKVYNAVITSNQNLSPSRAYPVIQPVIHQTAIGYVPPVYYSQVATTRFVNGVDLTRSQPQATEESQEYVKTIPGGQSTLYRQAYPNSREVKQDFDKVRNVESKEEAAKEEREMADGRLEEKTVGDAITMKKKPKNEEEPALSFYPNYQSLYYDPYFYTYNGLNTPVLPGTYYVNYQPYESAIAVPSATRQVETQWNQGAESSSLVDHRPGKNKEANGEAEKIPDVPPPPLPTALPKKF